MGDTNSSGAKTVDRRTHRLAIAITALALVIGVGWWRGLFDDSEAIEIDLRGEASAEEYFAPNDRESTLRVAVAAMISPKPTKNYYEDLLHLIGRKIDRRIILSQRRTYAEVNGLLQRREIDLAFVCSGPYVTGHDEFGMEILAVPVAHGEKVYYSYFLAHRDSDIESLEDLRGKNFAFTDPHSNTGCLVPTYVLAQRGDTPESFFAETFFTLSHDGSIKAVAEGVADGAAVDQLIWEFMNANDPAYTSRTKIIEKSPPYCIPPLVVHPELDRDLKDRLREVLLSLHEDEQGMSLLRELQIDRFELADDAAYDSVREMLRWMTENSEVEK